MNKKRFGMIAKDILLLLLLILGDQISKYCAVHFLKGKDSMILIPDILQLTYLENRGAAFGMMQNQKIFFVFVSIIVLGIIGYILLKAPLHKKYNKLHLALVFISGGAIGNMIDRIRLNYVVDFIYFSFIHFPIFNVADIYVTIASCYLIFLLCFVYKEHDLNFISIKPKHYREIK